MQSNNQREAQNKNQEAPSSAVSKIQSAIVGTLLAALLGYVYSLGTDVSRIAESIKPVDDKELRDHVIRLLQNQIYMEESVRSLDQRMDTAYNQIREAASALIQHSYELASLQEEDKRQRRNK